ncbi:MAG: CapA family protein [Romboutsia sp.]|nr:CapA family protein [Romboutsia sp.]
MAHQPQLDAQYDVNTNSYNFDNNFKFIKKYINSSNLAIANLETTLRGEPYTSYPQFSSPDSLLTALKNTGFDVISTINNHTNDTGKKGIKRTLEVIKEHNLDSVGTRNNLDEKNYIIKNVDGIKVGIAAFSYGDIISNNKYLNGLKVSSEISDLVNVIESNDSNKAFNRIKPILSDINTEGVDLTIVVVHWGEEYQREPNNFQKELAQLLCNEGVDIILGSHPHVIQPIEILSSANSSNEETNETFVVYSMGNFLSNQRNEILNKFYTEDGIIPIFDIEKNLETNKTTIKKLEYIPTWVNKYYDNIKNKNVYEIIPYIQNDSFLSTLDELTLKKLTKSYENTTSIMPNSDRISPMKSN